MLKDMKYDLFNGWQEMLQRHRHRSSSTSGGLVLMMIAVLTVDVGILQRIRHSYLCGYSKFVFFIRSTYNEIVPQYHILKVTILEQIFLH